MRVGVEIYGDTATVYRDFAVEAYGSPCFEEWALGVAEDPEVLAWLATLPDRKRQANLVFAAARWHGVPAPGPYDALRAALLGDGPDGPIRATILSRATQTNEVGRLATLLPAFASVAGGRPISLIEVGTSAGLCLFPDRFAYRWTGGDIGGDIHEIGDGPLLTCEVTGEPPLPARRTDRRVARRHRPGYPSTWPTTTRWRGSRCWCGPSRTNAASGSRAAVAIARADLPRIERGDLLERLPALLDEARHHQPDAEVVVFHSAVIAYLTAPDRVRFATMMAELVAAGRCRWVSNEGPARAARRRTGRSHGAAGPYFVLGVDGRGVAFTHGHGATLDWL